MWVLLESIIVLVAIALAAALLACRAGKTLSGEDGCGCGHEKGCSASSLDSLLADGEGAGEDQAASDKDA